MKKYLETLITEKGKSLETEINIEGHIGLTYEMLADYIDQCPAHIQKEIKTGIVRIDFKNDDVFHYLDFLAVGMLKALGY